MMPVIRISDATSKKLQQLAIPLEDNYDTVIARLAEAALNGLPYKKPLEPTVIASNISQVTPSAWDVDTHDDLTHTRLTSAKFDNIHIQKVSWNNLAKYAIEMAYRKLGSFEALRVASRAHLRQGKYEKEGFFYLPDIDISVQGMDSNMSWDNSVRLAHTLGVPVEVVFEWRNNDKAVKPGQIGRLRYDPT
jgi:hypothetical protein